MRRMTVLGLLATGTVASLAWAANTEPEYKVQISVPKEHTIFSVVIDNDQGFRVRNLVSMGTVQSAQVYAMDLATMMGESSTAAVPEQASVAAGNETTLTLKWDGRDDDGNAVPAGQYHVRGISHAGLDALYEYSFYNPGTPPWHGYPNSHWGSNHGDPVGIACIPPGSTSQWRTVVACNASEGTDFLFAIGRNDRKAYGWQMGWGTAHTVAIADGAMWVDFFGVLHKIELDTARELGWNTPDGWTPEARYTSEVANVAVGLKTAAVTLLRRDNYPKDTLLFIDKNSGRPTAEVDLPHGPVKIAFGRGDVLYAASSNGVVTVSPSGTLTPVALPGLVKPGAICSDTAGNLLIMDEGPDQQIKVYSPDYSPLRTIGVRGGQQGLQYNPDALHERLYALSVDDRGYVWTTEGSHPRRQAVWGTDGKRVQEFVGSTYYGAWNTTLHDQDPTIAMDWNLLLKIDPSQVKSYTVDRYLWSGRKEGSPFFLENGVPWCFFHRNQIFRSNLSGTMREYLLQTSTQYPILYVRNEKGDYRPVAAVWFKSPLHANLTPWSRPSDPNGCTYVWSDLNGDELVQDEEALVLPGVTASAGCNIFPFPHTMEFYIGGYEVKPTRFLPNGAPVYGPEGFRRLRFDRFSDVVKTVQNDPNHIQQPEERFMTRVGNHLWNAIGDWPYFFTGKQLIMNMEGDVMATIKIRGGGVHGSMAVAGPLPDGEMLGELFTAGTAKVNDEIGWVHAIQGNYGQAYVLTEDGIFVSSLFRDVRSNPEGWGDTQERGKSWKNISMYQEAFCAWFGRQDDGKFRYMFGHTSANVVEVTGLDTLKRFTGNTITVEPSL